MIEETTNISLLDISNQIARLDERLKNVEYRTICIDGKCKEHSNTETTIKLDVKELKDTTFRLTPKTFMAFIAFAGGSQGLIYGFNKVFGG